MRNKNVKILTMSTILLSVSLILGYLESLVPINVGEVGIKIGLSNIVSIVGLKTIGFKRTFLINILRLVILGMLFGNLVRFILSVSGFLLSYIVMSMLIRSGKFSITFSSIIGGVCHNIGQFIALIFIIGTLKILYLLPVYILLGILTGFLVGFVSLLILKKLNIFESKTFSG